MTQHKIELGDKVKDIVTGVEGIAATHIRYITGEDQIGIQQQLGKDEKSPPLHYADVGRLKYIDKGIHLPKVPPRIGFNNIDYDNNEEG